MKEKSELLKQLPFWNNLTDIEKNLIDKNSSLQSFSKGSPLFGSEDLCFGMLYLIKGVIRVYLLSEDGREISLFKLASQDSCVLSASCVLHHITFETSMTAEEDIELLIINSGAFGKLMDLNIHVRCFAYELTTERFSQVMWVLQQIVFSRFDKRLASYLVGVALKSGKDEINMTQEAIAKDINSAREVVARMLKHFSDDGLVELKRGKIILKNKESLKQIGQV